MSYFFYKVVHLLGVMMVFLSLGGAVLRSVLKPDDTSMKKLISITHGVGLLISLVAGFGLLAKLGLSFPAWAVAKLVIWLIFGGLIALINKNPKQANLWWILMLVLGTLATYIALYKPF